MTDLNPLDAITYVKGMLAPSEVPLRKSTEVDLPFEDSPAFKSLCKGLGIFYLVDAGSTFSYVQYRHLRKAGIPFDEFHARAVKNLESFSDGRVLMHRVGPVFPLTLEGNFESSLLLLDHMWDVDLLEHHGGNPVIAVPARDMLSFCSASSHEGIAALRSLIGRVWVETGDHLVSDKLFFRRDGKWLREDEVG